MEEMRHSIRRKSYFRWMAYKQYRLDLATQLAKEKKELFDDW